MKILIDTDELAEFYKNEWREVVTSAEDLRSFLAAFCKQNIEGEEEREEQPTKSETCPKFNSITYFTRDQAQKHLELLRDAIRAFGEVSVKDYYRLAEFLLIIPKWTAMYFKGDYGWKDLSTARINTVHNGGVDLWTLEMPEPKKLDI